MEVTRRQFLTLMGGSAAGAVLFQACGVPEDELIVQSSLEMPEDMVTGLDNWYATLCRQCPTSEGVVVRVMEGRAKKVEGSVDYPINRGKHSARCEAALQGLYDPDRITGPLLRVGERGEGRWQEISWTDAVARLADQIKKIEDRSAVAMVTDPVGGHLGMVVDHFVSALGGRHLAYEPLERTTLRAAIERVFRQDVMPDFDIENANYILSFGADFLDTWVSPVRYARGYGEFRQGDRPRGTMVHVGPRFSMTAANADRWMYVQPGMEGLFALSIAHVIVSDDLADQAVVDTLTGLGEVDLDNFAPEVVVGELVGEGDSLPAPGRPSIQIDTGEYVRRMRSIAKEFAQSGPSLAIGGGSAAAHTNGLSNLVAIYSLNHLVGSVGKQGGVVLNPPSPLDDVPVATGAASFADIEKLVSDMERGRVELLMVRGSDPMYSVGQSAAFRQATDRVPTVVSFSGRLDDTTAMADLVLPENHPLEDWGSDVPDPGPGYQVLGLQQPVVRPFFESRGVHLGTIAFADVLLKLSKVLTLDEEIEFDLQLPGETFREILEDGARKLFESGRGSVKPANGASFQAYWNALLQRGGWWDTGATFEGSPPRGRQLIGVDDRPAFNGSKDTFPFHLVPFASTSITDGRGAHLPWLQATPDPITSATWRTWVEINARVAEDMGIREGDVVRVSSQRGTIKALAYPHPGTAPNVLSMPFGQGHRAGGTFAEDRGSNVFDILSPLTDENTGAWAWAATRVRLEKTDEWVRLPKFENTAPDLAVDEEEKVIKVTSHDS